MNKLTFGTRQIPEAIIDLRVARPNKKSKLDAVIVTFIIIHILKLDEKKSGVINAEEPGMGKVRPYSI